MKNVYTLLTLAIAVLSCAKDVEKIYIRDNPHYQNFDSETHSFVKAYESESRKWGRPTSTKSLDSMKLVPTIKIIDKNGNVLTSVIGVCYTYHDGRTEIELLSAWWYSALHVEKKLLVFHEVAHCVQRRGHWVSNGLSNIDCVSIMSPYLIDNETAARCWENMSEELFQPAKYHLELKESAAEHTECSRQDNGSLACPVFEQTNTIFSL